MVNNRHQNNGSSNGRSDLKTRPKKRYEATEEEFDKLIAEFDYEARLKKEKARTEELLKEREQVQKEQGERIAQLQAEIRRLKNLIAEKQVAAAAAPKPIAAEQVADVVPRVVRPRQLHLEHSPAPREPVKHSEVPERQSSIPETTLTTRQTSASHLKPPRLPRKSMPAALSKVPIQEDFSTKSDEENNNVAEVNKKPVESVVDGVLSSFNDQEVGTVLQFASAATTPNGELNTPTENGASVKFRRHVRTASLVSRLIQGFEAVAAANTEPATPSRAGSFRINRRSLV